MKAVGIAALAGLTLLGCKNESASLRFPGPDHALTVDLRQPYPWSKEYEIAVVMQRLPDCQRRSRLGSVAPAQARVEVFRPPEGLYAEPILVLKQGAMHYALSTQNCELQPFKAAPKEPGQRLGNFEMEGAKLKYVAAPVPKAVAAPAAPPALAAAATPAPVPQPAPAAPQ